VIGINTLVAGQAEPGVPAQGIGFAISINTAKGIAQQLVATGHVDHPYLGISYVPLTPVTAAQLGLPNDHGVVIGQVAAGSPAATAGLQPRDVVIAVDGKQLEGESDLAQILSSHKPGDQVKLTIVRGGQQQDVTVTLGTLPTS
jgi:S1-C subfamily serine protease